MLSASCRIWCGQAEGQLCDCSNFRADHSAQCSRRRGARAPVDRVCSPFGMRLAGQSEWSRCRLRRAKERAEDDFEWATRSNATSLVKHKQHSRSLSVVSVVACDVDDVAVTTGVFPAVDVRTDITPEGDPDGGSFVC